MSELKLMTNKLFDLPQMLICIDLKLLCKASP